MSCLRRQLLREYNDLVRLDVRDWSFASICRGEPIFGLRDTRKYCATLSISRPGARAATMMLLVSDV